jgi:Stress responsive A/B Barrel Domain
MLKTKRLLLGFVAMILLASFTYATQTAMHSPHKTLRHVVLFKFKDTSSPQDVKHVADTFVALKGKIPQIVDLEWGINNSPENFHQGFTHCFMLSYRSEKDLADYQNHPAHRAFQEVLKPHMEKVFVVDYWVE